MVLVSGEFWMSMSSAFERSGSDPSHDRRAPRPHPRRRRSRHRIRRGGAAGVCRQPSAAAVSSSSRVTKPGRLQSIVDAKGHRVRAELGARRAQSIAAEIDRRRLGQPFLDPGPDQEAHGPHTMVPRHGPARDRTRPASPRRSASSGSTSIPTTPAPASRSSPGTCSPSASSTEASSPRWPRASPRRPPTRRCARRTWWRWDRQTTRPSCARSATAISTPRRRPATVDAPPGSGTSRSPMTRAGSAPWRAMTIAVRPRR